MPRQLELLPLSRLPLHRDEPRLLAERQVVVEDVLADAFRGVGPPCPRAATPINPGFTGNIVIRNVRNVRKRLAAAETAGSPAGRDVVAAAEMAQLADPCVALSTTEAIRSCSTVTLCAATVVRVAGSRSPVRCRPARSASCSRVRRTMGSHGRSREVAGMDVTLNLTPELGHRLQRAARKHGVSADEYTLRLLDRHVPGDSQAGALASLLQSWIEEEDGAGEQRETGEYLVRTLDEDRLSGRQLFPTEHKGVTW